MRKNVKKARRAGVRIEFDATGARLDDFLRLYEHTLERRDAPERYRFPREFFERLPRAPRVYVHALHDDARRLVGARAALASATRTRSSAAPTATRSSCGRTTC